MKLVLYFLIFTIMNEVYKTTGQEPVKAIVKASVQAIVKEYATMLAKFCEIAIAEGINITQD